MNIQDVIAKAGRILDEERINPSVRYLLGSPVANPAAPNAVALGELGSYRRTVQERPQSFIFGSANFDLLCTLLDQIPQSDWQALFSATLERPSDKNSYRDSQNEVSRAGQRNRCTSELPLIAEFNVRRGDKRVFFESLSKTAVGPGLTILLVHLDQMIALNFTLLTDEEYRELEIAVRNVRSRLLELQRQPMPLNTTESYVISNVCNEARPYCDSVLESCRKARFLFLKADLLPTINLEINQDKGTVVRFLEKLGFNKLLIQSLDEAEKLYREAVTPFDLKNVLGHLRSFLEQLHLQTCAAAHAKFGGSLPSKWGEALVYLRDNGVLSKEEEPFAAKFYTLMSDTGVHPLIAEHEYARLMRNMSIEYGLLLLTKLDKLGLK